MPFHFDILTTIDLILNGMSVWEDFYLRDSGEFKKLEFLGKIRTGTKIFLELRIGQ